MRAATHEVVLEESKVEKVLYLCSFLTTQRMTETHVKAVFNVHSSTGQCQV